MAINVYSGLMGSGKTFELVRSVILPAVLSGRRVVSNIAGLNKDLIYEYLIAKHKLDADYTFSDIVLVEDEVIRTAGFFPIDGKPEIESVVRAGDLVAIDEAWRFWSTGQKISAEHMQFFRMHRHFVNSENGFTCDLSFIFQNVSDIARSLKAVVELNFRTTKLKTLGLNTSYRIELFEGAKSTKNALISVYVQKYSIDIFPLYKSYAGDNAKEVSQDKRQNILLKPSFWYTVVFIVIGILFGIYKGIGFFYRSKTESPKFESPKQSISSSNSTADTTQSVPTFKRSRELRLAGSIQVGNAEYSVISQSDFRTRLLPISELKGLRHDQYIYLDREHIDYSSGSTTYGNQQGLLP